MHVLFVSVGAEAHEDAHHVSVPLLCRDGQRRDVVVREIHLGLGLEQHL